MLQCRGQLELCAPPALEHGRRGSRRLEHQKARPRGLRIEEPQHRGQARPEALARTALGFGGRGEDQLEPRDARVERLEKACFDASKDLTQRLLEKGKIAVPRPV
jgi:hypothetical protein